MAVDGFGNLYIADEANSRIRKVGTNGIITTVAGKNGFGYSGDGGAATNALLYDPYGVAVDNLGNIFIADEGNRRIRKVNGSGIDHNDRRKRIVGLFWRWRSGDQCVIVLPCRCGRGQCRQFLYR